jgi:hypothetical protein
MGNARSFTGKAWHGVSVAVQIIFETNTNFALVV